MTLVYTLSTGLLYDQFTLLSHMTVQRRGDGAGCKFREDERLHCGTDAPPCERLLSKMY